MESLKRKICKHSRQLTWNLTHIPMRKKSMLEKENFLPGIAFKRNYVRKSYSIVLARKTKLNKP